MQMLQWEKSLFVNVTVTLIYATPQRQRVLSEAYFKHSPGLSVYALVMSAYLVVFFSLLLNLSPTGLKGNDSTHQTAHLHLNAHRFYPSNFPRGSGLQIHPGDPT